MGRVSLRNVTQRFGSGDPAVNDLSLKIADGDFFSLVGPSGCGKTTTMRMIAGLEQPTEGQILMDGQTVYDSRNLTVVPAHRRGIGMVFQNYALWPHMSVRQNVLFGLRLHRLPKEEQERRLRETLTMLQIDAYAERYPNELSGGQQQRVALARELVLENRVLLMDEPLSNLDAQLRLEMRNELKRLHHETGQTIIYVTHDQIEALTLSTKVAVMKDGVMQQCATPDDLYFRPANIFTASFIGNMKMNLVPGELKDGAVRGAGFTLPLPSGVSLTDASAVTVGLRPEDLNLAASPAGADVTGTVSSVLPMGSVALVQVELGSSGTQLTIQHDRTFEVTAGDQVGLLVNREHLHLFDSETGLRLGS